MSSALVRVRYNKNVVFCDVLAFPATCVIILFYWYDMSKLRFFLRKIWILLTNFSSMIRLSHTIFGLPFTLASVCLAIHMDASALSGWKLLWIILAFTGARSTAMAFNRIVDRHFDGKNPRTAMRELPRGAISLASAWAFTGLASGLFLLASWALGPLPLRLAPVCLLIVCAYSLMKRFSWASHVFLGLALSLAPGGAWIAITGSFHHWPIPLLLMFAVATWVAGFDILYSLQDEVFDRSHGLFSIPVRFGTAGALTMSSGLHVFTVLCLLALHLYASLGIWHGIGVGLITAMLIYEHRLVRPDDLRHLNRAFFDLNGYISIAYLICVGLDVLGGRL